MEREEHLEHSEREEKEHPGKGHETSYEGKGRGPAGSEGGDSDVDDARGSGDGGSGDGGSGDGGSGARGGGGPDGSAGTGRPSRIPTPRSSVEDTGLPLPAPAPLVLEHRVLKSLLGAWALAACSGEETAAVEEHLGECGACADEALRLRGAVGLLHPPESLDLDPALRTRVLESCLDRRPPRIPVPEWAAPYDAETARLDALLQDIADAEWHAPVRLRWFEDDGPVSRRTTVA
ncbi:zf-HC2 domain-containing protein, partial [Streptomyces sp. NPDC005122]